MGTNRGEAPVPPAMRKQFPRLRPGPVSPPYAPVWHARADQLTHPLAAMHGGGFFLGLSVAPTLPDERTFNGFFCGVAPHAQTGFTLGHAEEPGIYRSPFDFEPRGDPPGDGLTLLPGAQAEIPFWAYAFPAEDALVLGAVLEAVYTRCHQAPRPGAERSEAVEKIARAMLEDAYDAARKTFALVALAG